MFELSSAHRNMNVRHRGIKLLGHCAFAGLAPTLDVGLNFSVRLRWRSGGALLEMDDDFLLIPLVHLRAAVALFPHYIVIFPVLEVARFIAWSEIERLAVA